MSRRPEEQRLEDKRKSKRRQQRDKNIKSEGTSRYLVESKGQRTKEEEEKRRKRLLKKKKKKKKKEVVEAEGIIKHFTDIVLSN